MPSFLSFATFGLIALGMVLTPGPNMMYVVSRSICQGRSAGMVSLGGVGIGFIVWLLLAAFGITAIVVAVPFAYGALKLAGAAYLGWLAWQALRPGGSSPFAIKPLAPDSPMKLFAMGLVTNLLNPKAAVLYLSLLPQFIDRPKGHVFEQSLALGAVQIALSLTVNSMVICAAGSIAGFLARRPTWARVQRVMMGCVLGGLAIRMAAE
jgi:threonine/homoserine/homoserine lactone efflux protein